MARICVVDDKELLRESVSETLSREDHRVTTFEQAENALPEILAGRFDLVLTDLKMPKMDGISLLRAIRDGGCETPVIVMTAFGSISSAVEAMQLGAFDYIQKPFEAEAIAVQVDRALQHGQLRSDNEALRASLQDLRSHRSLIGDSDAMMEVRLKISRVARSSATVLICGESGTGKELVAWAIHEASQRVERPMLCLNCAALSDSLLESELFGHERGAFTGADRVRKGRFELANGGTLLLDEISETAMPLQAKLLRVLQEGEFERVGSSTSRRADVRVLATTNRNLAEWVAKKNFREDLYYRLNVLPIVMPPLRERREDIPLLADYFMQRIAGVERSSVPRFSSEAMKLMRQYDWPGNVRELENLCQRAAVLVADDMVGRDVIESWMHKPATMTEFSGKLRSGRMLEDMERQLIERTLVRFNGHREKTAKELGMGVRTLGMKLKQWREAAAAAAAAQRDRQEVVGSVGQ